MSFSYAGASYPDGLPGIGGEHLLKERRRLSDYLLLHKVFIANRFYKRNSAGKNRVWVSPFIQKKGSEPFLRERSDTIKAFETPYLDERSGKV